jgi:hypothetical protein
MDACALGYGRVRYGHNPLARLTERQDIDAEAQHRNPLVEGPRQILLGRVEHLPTDQSHFVPGGCCTNPVTGLAELLALGGRRR